MKGILIAALMVSVAYADDGATGQNIRALINKLAISGQPASKEPFVTYNNPRNAELVKQVHSALPNGYSDTASLYRRGADGELHEQPVWSKEIYDGVGARKWLTDRKGKTLRELQIEAIEWVLKIQNEIGARTKAERDEYITPLEEQLARLRKEAEPGSRL